MSKFYTILGLISTTLGFLLLIASCIIADQYNYSMPSEPEFVTGTRAAGALGIIGALIQLGFSVLLFYNLYQRADSTSLRMVVLVAHLLVGLVTLIAFSVGVHYYNVMAGLIDAMVEVAQSQPNIPGQVSSILSSSFASFKSKYQFLNAATGMDWIFSLAAVLLTWCSPGCQRPQSVEDVQRIQVPKGY